MASLASIDHIDYLTFFLCTYPPFKNPVVWMALIVSYYAGNRNSAWFLPISTDYFLILVIHALIN